MPAGTKKQKPHPIPLRKAREKGQAKQYKDKVRMKHGEKETWSYMDLLERSLVSSARRRRRMANVLFDIFVIMAIVIVSFCLWAYICDVQ
jgi:hypothetical protein